MNDLENLIARLLVGELSAEESKQLEALLTNDPEARRLYVTQCQLHAQLMSNPELKPLLQAEELIDGSEVAGETEVTASKSWPWRLVVATAAMSALLVFATMQWTQSDASEATETAAVAMTTPEAAYEQAEFADVGSLKRPPTNFAVVTGRVKPGAEISFNRDVRPIFSENCYQCHGPDANSRKAELRLDIEASAFAPHGKFEAPIVRGDPEASPLYKRITSELKSEIMPPLDSHKSLSVAEKSIVRNWIKQGAKWEGHWAFEQPKKTDPAPSSWGRGSIDAFIAAKHREEGLAPNPAADKATLARRLALDLTGLPARPERVAKFLTDEQPDAYERYVDELLASPAYGEHQARYWLDAARYSDTHGLHLDNYREIWPYRDWVVQAFNRNQPYDEFTVEQIAGDLLPNPTEAQLLATGFSRCSPTTSEGGAIEDEYRAIYAKDRAETAATVYLGLTVGCAACHDHKFDPISQKDFYAFSAFFNNIDGPIMDGNAYDTEPNLVIPRPEHRELWTAVKADYQKQRGEFDRLKKEKKAAFDEWLAEENPTVPTDTIKAHWSEELRVAESENDLGQEIDLPAEIDEWGVDAPFTFVVDYKFPTLAEDEETLVASKFDGDRGWRLFALGGDDAQPERYRIRFELISSWAAGNLISITSQAKRYVGLTAGKTLPLTVSYDGSGRALGVQLGYADRLPIDGRNLVDNLTGSFANGAQLRVALTPLKKPKLESESDEDDEEENSATKSAVDSRNAFRVFASAVPLHRLGDDQNTKSVLSSLAKPRKDLSSSDTRKLKEFYFSAVDPETSAARDRMAEFEPAYRHVYDLATISLIMKEREEAAVAHILMRGEYDQKGEEVAANVPQVLGGLADELPKNRLGLARWLVDDRNPLTARVTVNRIWQNLFGTGLVATTEDFGIMGENPTHPELLDWLAVDFREKGWDLKALIKQIVTTETYRQDAKIDAAEYAADPENRWLARGPRYRLDAEVIRDQALFVSGALQDRVGGPPVKPYQPVGIWNAVAYSGSNTRYYHEGEDEALYRRSLYTFWKRTAPPPSMTTFDAPSRENCSVRRDRTNTPLQALILMNDPQFVEAARLLAQRVLAAPDLSVDGQIGAMYRYAFGTTAPVLHGKILAESYRKFESEFRRNPEEASKLVSYGASSPMETGDVVGHASLTMVASQIMNLDSFINKN